MQDSKAIQKSQVTILLAEDNSVSASMVYRLLTKSRGYSVDIVENGEDALIKSLKREYSLIILDQRMPQIDGLNVGVCLRCGKEHINKLSIPSSSKSVIENLWTNIDTVKEQQLRITPILLYSARSNHDIIEECDLNGMVFVDKDGGIENFLRIVDTLIQGNNERIV